MFVAKCIEKHRETLDPSNPRDYIDAFLIEMKAKAASNEEHYFDGALKVNFASVPSNLFYKY